MQEVDDLLQGLLGLVLSGDVLEGDAGGFFHINLCIGFAHIADTAEASAAGLAHEPHQQHEQAHHDDDRQDIVDHQQQNGVHLRLIVAGIGHLVLLQQRQQLAVAEIGGIQRQRPVLRLLVGLLLRLAAGGDLLGVDVALYRGDVDGAVLEQDLLHLVFLHHVDHFAVFDLVAGGFIGGVVVVGVEIVERHRQHQRPGDERKNAPQVAVFVIFSVLIVVISVIFCHIYILPVRQESFLVLVSIPQAAESHKPRGVDFPVKFL